MTTRHGYEWRILARIDNGKSITLASPESETKTEETCNKLGIQHERQPVTPPNTYFDELVIDDWLHLERMNENTWWLGLGDKRIWIRLDDTSKAQVSIESENQPE